MKKKYVQPQLTSCILNMAPAAMICVSLYDTAATVDGSGNLNNEVKSGRGSRQDYNVWNDDWSK